TESTASILQLPGGRGGKFKLPTLTELHQYLFNQPFAEAHNATADVEATTRCFFELLRREAYAKEELDVPADYIERFKKENPGEIQLIGLKHINLKAASEEIRQRFKQAEQATQKPSAPQTNINLADVDFVHLHNHTQFSVLQSTISVGALVKAAIKHRMPAVAMTDHANLMGAFHFVRDILNHNKSVDAKIKAAEESCETVTDIKIKPIVGCEFFVCEDHKDKTRKDNGYQIVMLAKTKKGYHNLAKMSSIAYTEGFYYVPRIDRKVIEQYKEDIIVLSGNLYGEIPNKLLNIGENQAEEALIWWKEKFGADFYIEVMRHNQEDENRINSSLVSLARKHEVKLVATNNTFYLEKADSSAHDILLCVRDGEKKATLLKWNPEYTAFSEYMTVRDSRMTDPVALEDSDNHGTESYVLNVANGSSLLNYAYGPIIMYTYQDQANPPCSPAAPCGPTSPKSVMFGGEMKVPG
ncbi:MAG: PHP domain-containing protein, partial [Proteobacteria bacterium]